MIPYLSLKGGILVKRIVLFLCVVAALFLFSCGGMPDLNVPTSGITSLAQQMVDTLNGVLQGTVEPSAILNYVHKGPGVETLFNLYSDQLTDEILGTLSSVMSEVSLIGISGKVTPNKLFSPDNPPYYFRGEVYSMTVLVKVQNTRFVMDLPLLLIDGSAYLCTVYTKSSGSEFGGIGIYPNFGELFEDFYY